MSVNHYKYWVWGTFTGNLFVTDLAYNNDYSETNNTVPVTDSGTGTNRQQIKSIQPVRDIQQFGITKIKCCGILLGWIERQ